MQISTSVDISSKPEGIFPWVAQPEKAMRWQKDVKGGEIIEETPERVGTKFKEEIEQDGKSLVMYGEITKYIPDRAISFHLESKVHSFDVDYSVTGKADIGKSNTDKATISTFTIDLKIKWKFPINIASLILGRKMREGILKQTKSELAELKRLCEKGQSDSSKIPQQRK